MLIREFQERSNLCIGSSAHCSLKETEIAKVHWLVLIMMKELVCSKEVLHQMSKDFMVQSRHEEGDADKEIVILFFLFVIEISHPQSDCELRCFFSAVVTDKFVMNAQVTLCCQEQAGSLGVLELHTGVKWVSAPRHSWAPSVWAVHQAAGWCRMEPKWTRVGSVRLWWDKADCWW